MRFPINSPAHPRYRWHAKYVKRVYSTDTLHVAAMARVRPASFSRLLSARHNAVFSGRPQFAVIIMFIFLIHLNPHTDFDDPSCSLFGAATPKHRCKRQVSPCLLSHTIYNTGIDTFFRCLFNRIKTLCPPAIIVIVRDLPFLHR